MKWKLSLLLVTIAFSAQSQDCDILITNGKIIDGTGNNWYYGNIAVKNGKIIQIGRDVNVEAKKTIDAKGLIVAPGFIDVHTHLEDDEKKELFIKRRSAIIDGFGPFCIAICLVVGN